MKFQCTPQELAVLLPAFNKVADAFKDVDTPASVGLESPVLNEIISSFPKLREPVKDLLSVVNLKKASEGKKDSMWTNLERYPGIIDADMVRVDVPALRDLTDFQQAMQVIEVELVDELKASKTYIYQ